MKYIMSVLQAEQGYPKLFAAWAVLFAVGFGIGVVLAQIA